jgi:hypothetical protein
MKRKTSTGHRGRRCMRESKRAASVSDMGSKEEEGGEPGTLCSALVNDQLMAIACP